MSKLLSKPQSRFKTYMKKVDVKWYYRGWKIKYEEIN